ncbi:vanadium-dependent haloperoxidase [Actinomadura rayongensis]|uniref:Phosphatase PAP2 family protein n=1 Tax=Actinomadura rayongensis TaxID=1429076 RepID=A0A6I4W5U9_9ACTN|nr:vanadium-dependent haloperoxidase [Actinomadura rayongensis]MXQ64888.1 phosphatase PAP2 family protein [Actinomadura rayongensis]
MLVSLKSRLLGARRKLVAAAGTASVVAALAAPPGIARGTTTDHVVYWNRVLIDVYRGLTKVDAAPGPLARTAAMMNGAIYDAANSAACAGTSGCIGQPYLGRIPVPAGQSPDTSTAIDNAAYRVLSTLYPKSSYPQFDFDAKLSTAQATIPSGVTQDQRDQGASIGVKAAAVMAVTRAHDGSDNNAPYTPGTRPGDWQQTTPGPEGAALTPNWGGVQPFTMITTNQFRPNFPERSKSVTELLGTDTYKQHLQEVREKGRRDSTSRTADQTLAAHWWANDLDGTYKPPGHLIDQTITIADKLTGQTELKNAKLFALVSLAMSDAAISAWDVKFDTNTDLWRPQTAIRATFPDDPNWVPESKNGAGVSFSPPFPAYISGHATFAGAWAGVLKRYVGGDAFSWTATTDDPYAKDANGRPITRSFTSFSSAAQEDALSRIWLGVHYRADGEYGNATGDNVANWVVQNFLGVPAQGAVLATDSFERTVSGGLGAADTGGDWWVQSPAGDYSVSNGAGHITLSAPATGRSAYPNRVIAADTDLTVKVGIDKPATGNGVYVTAVGRKVEGAGTYRSVLTFKPDGGVAVQLRRTDAAGVETNVGPLQTISGLTYTPGTKLHLRLQVTGTSPTTLKTKVWADGTTEPTSWLQTVTDSTTALQGAGRAGLLAYLSASSTNAPVTVDFDDFQVSRPAG